MTLTLATPPSAAGADSSFKIVAVEAKCNGGTIDVTVKFSGQCPKKVKATCQTSYTGQEANGEIRRSFFCWSRPFNKKLKKDKDGNSKLSFSYRNSHAGGTGTGMVKVTIIDEETGQELDTKASNFYQT